MDRVEVAKTYGFSDAAVIDCREIVVVLEYRKYCEQNLCGMYGRNYSCPPYCGSVAEMTEKMQQFAHALILRSDYLVNNAMDPAETIRLKIEHNKRTREFVRHLKAVVPEKEYLLMTAGPCGLCEKCRMPEGKPCPFPQEKASCMSAYCIDVTKLAESGGMKLGWDMDKVSLFSIYLF